MKVYILLIIFILTCELVYAQPETSYYTSSGGTLTGGTPALWYTNLEKYWYYRYKLVNDFMYIGVNAGESLPASRRDLGDNPAWHRLLHLFQLYFSAFFQLRNRLLGNWSVCFFRLCNRLLHN